MGSLGRLRIITVLGAALGLAVATGGPTAAEPPDGAPLLLVSQDEIDALPSDVPVAWGKPQTSPDGPTIEIHSPEERVYRGPFPISVEFSAGPAGYAVDMESLKLEYKKAWGIDITDRVVDYLVGNKIQVDDSELPKGRHTVEVQIRDVEKNLSIRLFTVIVE